MKWKQRKQPGIFDEFISHGYKPLTATALCRAGIDDLTKAKDYLQNEEILNPALIRNIEVATGIIWKHIYEGNLICVFGDYDADGITASAIMFLALRKLGAKVNIITRSSPLCFIATGKYWVNNHAHVMRPKQGFDLRFVCEALESIDYTKYNTGTAQPKLNQEKCRQILFTYPCYEEQQCISSFLSSITKRIMDSEEQLSLLETQKKSLLQQLFI